MKKLIDFIKLNGGDALLAWLVSTGLDKIPQAIGGFWGKLVGLFITFVVKPILNKYRKIIRTSKEAQDKREEFEKAEAIEGRTNEDVIKADDDYFNRDPK